MSEPNNLPVGTNEATPGPQQTSAGGVSPGKVVTVSLTGASHSEHDTDVPGVEAVSVQAGHEPDKFQVKSILAVPALLVAMILATFTIVTVLFVTQYTRFLPNTGSPLNPQSAAVNTVTDDDGKNRRDRDVSERFSRIGSTAPKDVPGLPGTALAQPRLEYLKQTAPETPDDPAWERSKRPVDSPSNTYEVRPEDLRPLNYTDPVTREKVLATYGWVDEGRKVARMPIAEAMKQVVVSKKLKARKDAIPAPGSSIHTPTLSNGGRPVQGNATQASGGPTPPMPGNHGQKTPPADIPAKH